MGGRGSGGHNAVSIAEHLARGTFRPGRHGERAARESAEVVPMTPQARRRALAGLSREARAIASALLDEFSGWDGASLQLLRAFAEASARLDKLQADPNADPKDVRAEVRAVVALYRALDLESDQ